MPARIRLETDNQTRPGFDAASRDLQGLADKLGTGQDAVKQLNKELDGRRQKEFRAEMKRVADELDGTAEKMREAKAAAAQLADEQKRLADRAKASADFQQQSMKAVVDVYQVLKDVIEVASRAVVAMADAGNPAAQSLVTSFSQFKRELIEAANESRGLTGAMEDMATSVQASRPAISGTIDLLGKWWQLNRQVIDTGPDVIAFIRGQTKELEEQRKGLKTDIEVIAARAAQQKSWADAQAALGRIESARAAEERKALLEEIEDIDELNKLYKQKLDRIRELGNDTKKTAEERKRQLADEERAVGEVIERVKQLEAEKVKAAEQVEKTAEEERKKSQEAAEWQLRYLEEFEALKKKFADDEIQRQRQLLAMQEHKTAAIKEEQRILEDRQKAALGAAGQGNVEAVLGAVDPRRARAQLAKQRDEQFMGTDAAGNMSPAELRRERAKVRRDTFKQFNSGNVSSGDMIDAQAAVVEQQLQASGQQSKMGAASVGAFRETVEGLKQVKGEAESQAAEIQFLRKTLDQLMNRKGQHRRDSSVGR